MNVNPYFGTKKQYDLEPSDGKYNCPNCGLKMTTPHPGCGCPTETKNGYSYTKHINKYHHNCNIAWKEAYN